MTARRSEGPTTTTVRTVMFALAVGAVAFATLTIVPGSAAAAVPVRAPVPARAALPDRPTRVLALGDSVMEGAASAIPAALPGRDVTVDTEVSRSTGATAAAASTYGPDWDVVAILVGHNDGGSPGAYQPPYRQMLDQFAGAQRVAVLTIHEVRPYYADVNAFLRAEAAARPNVVVADWNAVASANPGALSGDGLHLNGQGAALMADLIAGQVTEAEGAATPPPPPPPPTTAPVTLPPTTATPATLPPTTTTTTAPTTTSSTTTAPATTIAVSTTVTEPGLVRAARPAASEGPGEDHNDGRPAPVGTAPVLAGAFLALTTVLSRLGRRLPA